MIQIFGNAPNQISCLTLITFALVMHIHLLLVSDQHSNIFPTLPNKLQSMKFTQIWVKGSKKKKPLWQSILSRKESRSFLCVEVPHFFFFHLMNGRDCVPWKKCYITKGFPAMSAHFSSYLHILHKNLTKLSCTGQHTVSSHVYLGKMYKLKRIRNELLKCILTSSLLFCQELVEIAKYVAGKHSHVYAH